MHKVQIHAGAIRNCIVYASVQEDNSQALALCLYHDFSAFPLIYVVHLLQQDSIFQREKLQTYNTWLFQIWKLLHVK